MTEEQWLACTDPGPMLRFLRGKGLARKRRLFAVASCQRIANDLADVSRIALDVAERYADGLATETERMAAWIEAGFIVDRSLDAFSVPSNMPAWCAYRAVESTNQFNRVTSRTRDAALWIASVGLLPTVGHAPLVGLLRCIFANPFRPPSLPDSKRTATVLALAASIYEERAFDRMPVLADALEEAGVTDPSILSHCRDADSHARGCHVLDGILRKDS